MIPSLTGKRTAQKQFPYNLFPEVSFFSPNSSPSSQSQAAALLHACRQPSFGSGRLSPFSKRHSAFVIGYQPPATAPSHSMLHRQHNTLLELPTKPLGLVPAWVLLSTPSTTPGGWGTGARGSVAAGQKGASQPVSVRDVSTHTKKPLFQNVEVEMCSKSLLKGYTWDARSPCFFLTF